MNTFTPPSSTFDEVLESQTGLGNDIIGCVLWLIAEIQAEMLHQCGLTKEVCNHPCIVVNTSSTFENGEKGLVICIVTSFKNKTAEEITRALRRSRSLIPILPNKATTKSATSLELDDDVRLRRDSWVQTSKTYTVPMSLVRQYDWKLPLRHFKLTKQSIQNVRTILGLPTIYKVPEPVARPIHRTTTQDSRPESSKNAISRQQTGGGFTHKSLLHQIPNQDISGAGLSLNSQAECNEYGTYRRSSPEPLHQIDWQQRVEQHQRQWNSLEPQRQTSSSRVESSEWDAEALRRMRRSYIDSRRSSEQSQMPHRVPLRETIKTIMFLGIGVAVVVGLGYGAYFLARTNLGILATFSHAVFSATSRLTSAIGGVWNWFVHMVRGRGHIFGRMWHTVASIVQKTVAAVKAMLGRN